LKSGFVAIVGEPNAGKSTLLNRWVGEHVAIVSPKAQTTRQAIRGILNQPGVQVVFVDTPGFHESDKAFNQYMIEKVKESIKDADVCCLVTDPVVELSALNQELLKYAKEKKKPVVIAVNKIDTIRHAGPAADASKPASRAWIPAFAGMTYEVSALNGDGCDVLLSAVIEKLPEGPALFPDDIYTEQSTRFLASELVREVLLEKLHQELPYSAAVMIDEFKEKPDITVIKAAIVVEKDSQKSMVIGARGSMIKEIGMEARARIEKLVDQKVFLELFVRVEKNWTKDAKKVEEMGYE
jgi:GTP-binding protein Era